MSSRPLRIAASATSTLALVAAGIAATTTAATAVGDVDTTLCAGTPVWTGGFTAGQSVHGLTTTHGITPESFSGEYVSTLKNGAGRGKDILLFKLEGSRITKTDADGNVNVDAGIWAGISGSPVYDDDNNLVGSVSYGFSGAPSNLAGITPAKDVLDIQSSPAAAAGKVAVPSAVSKQVAQSTTTTSDSASQYGYIRQLTLPKVSVGGSRLADAATDFAGRSRALNKKLNNATPKFSPGTQYDGDLDQDAAIVPGGNIATSWSHGDVALAAVGSITAVCGNQVFAYGHPDEFDGNKTNETFHAAYADYIQEDGTFGSYKLASIDQDPVGKLTQDRLSGILGIKGVFPTETTITTNTTLDGDSTQAVSKVGTPAAVSTVLASQLFNDVLDGLDAYANGGEAEVSWTINYTPQGGAAASYTRSQRISYNEYLAEQLPYEVASDVEFLQFGSDQKVAIHSITVNTALKPDYNALRISKVQYRKSTKVGKKTVMKWVTVKNGQRLSAQRGRTLPLQVFLTPANPDSVAAPAVKRIDQKIDKYAAGSGLALISGGQSYYPTSEEDFTIGLDEEDEEYFYEDETPATLAEVLAALKAQVRSDSVVSDQIFRNSNGTSKISRNKVSTSAVTRGDFALQLSYRK
ncbi:hypothetical protein [Aeromicrobium stalagmiti]|uniref:hypothetical protein n=1 Tax=Aeromicrobium stalagmiti TaxID=2738988 RepID=UPI00156815B8|nr:hypothetical protein [Aeromicrobium stalagmiti]NRQ49152.1 hypothetical protein [Aeromicrobium stalagmiti]